MTDEQRQVLSEVRATDAEIKILNLCFDIVMYTSHDFTQIPQDILFFYEKCLDTIPKGELRWYATENMSKHKPTSSRIMQMLPGWLKAGAAPRPIIHIHLKDGESYADAAGYSIWVWGNEPGEVSSHGRDSNVVRLSVPLAHAVDHAETLKQMVLDFAGRFPFDCGHAGFALEMTQYRLEASHRAAFRISMAHPGLDISNPITDSVALARGAMKGINWFTLVSDDMLRRIEGWLPALQHSSNVVLHKVGTGYAIQAGELPRMDDGPQGNGLDPYRSVYRVLAPLQAPLLNRYGAFDLPGGDHRQKTRKWLLRFGNA
jgi:hypothetical protein